MKRLSTIAVLFLLSTSLCLAIPAKPGPRIVTQPDGDTLTVFLHGDHRFNWLTDIHGNRIEQQADGKYVIAEPLTEEMVEQQISASPLLQCSKRHATAATLRETPLNIAPRGLVILVSFTDVAYKTSLSEMDDMLNGDNYSRSYSYKYYGTTTYVDSEGSAKKYFRDQSMGEYEPQFDVVGPLKLSKTSSYYGQNYNNIAGQDTYATDMIVEACYLADATGVDFTQYDNNNDGYLDFVPIAVQDFIHAAEVKVDIPFAVVLEVLLAGIVRHLFIPPGYSLIREGEVVIRAFHHGFYISFEAIKFFNSFCHFYFFLWIFFKIVFYMTAVFFNSLYLILQRFIVVAVIVNFFNITS